MKASIIHYCQDKETVTSKELAEALNIPIESVTKRISYWVARGILKETEKGIGDFILFQFRTLSPGYALKHMRNRLIKLLMFYMIQ